MNRYYDHEYIELIRMFDKEALAPHYPCLITNPYLWKLMSWLLFKLIIFTTKDHTPAIKLFINYTTKTLSPKNFTYRISNLWCTFAMPLNKTPLYISDKSMHKQIIAKWRLKVGK